RLADCARAEWLNRFFTGRPATSPNVSAVGNLRLRPARAGSSRELIKRIDRIELIWHREHVHALPVDQVRTALMATITTAARSQPPKRRKKKAETAATSVAKGF